MNPRVNKVRLQVTYKGDAKIDLDIGLPLNADIDTRRRIDEATAELIRLLMEAGQ